MLLPTTSGGAQGPSAIRSLPKRAIWLRYGSILLSQKPQHSWGHFTSSKSETVPPSGRCLKPSGSSRRSPRRITRSPTAPTTRRTWNLRHGPQGGQAASPLVIRRTCARPQSPPQLRVIGWVLSATPQVRRSFPKRQLRRSIRGWNAGRRCTMRSLAASKASPCPRPRWPKQARPLRARPAGAFPRAVHRNNLKWGPPTTARCRVTGVKKLVQFE